MLVNQQSYEGVEWDSFEMDDDTDDAGRNDEPEQQPKKPVSDKKQPPASPELSKRRDRSPSPALRPQLKEANKAPGSIGKLKISSEMRAKLELMTITQIDGPTGRSPSGSNGALAGGSSTEQLNDAKNGDIRKLEEHRRLMLQQQLAGRKWDSVEEVERITQRAASEDRTVTAATNTEMIIHQVERARRSSEVAILSRSSQYETAVQRSTSPPSTYHSLT